MHTMLFNVAILWLAILFGICIVQVIRAPAPMVRVLIMDTINLMLVALLVMFGASRRSAYYMDAALLIALLSFIATLAAARYRSEGRLF